MDIMKRRKNTSNENRGSQAGPKLMNETSGRMIMRRRYSILLVSLMACAMVVFGVGSIFADNTADINNGGTTPVGEYDGTHNIFTVHDGKAAVTGDTIVGSPYAPYTVSNVVQSRSQNSATTFASGLPLSTIYIDQSKISGDANARTCIFQPAAGPYSSAITRDSSGLVTYDAVNGSKKIMGGQVNTLDGELFYVEFPKAAILPNGDEANLRVTYSNARIVVDQRYDAGSSWTADSYKGKIRLATGSKISFGGDDPTDLSTISNSTGRQGAVVTTAQQYGTTQSFSSKSFKNPMVGMSIDVTYQIVDGNGTPVPGSFVFAIAGINLDRDPFRGINAGNNAAKPLWYVNDMPGGSAYHFFSEAMSINSGMVSDNIYVRSNDNGDIGDDNQITPTTDWKNNGITYQVKRINQANFWPQVTTDSNGKTKFIANASGNNPNSSNLIDDSQGSDTAYSNGFVTLADAAAGIKVTATGHGGGSSYNMNSTTFTSSTIWYRYRSGSGNHGKIELTDEGNPGGTLNTGTVLDGGKNPNASDATSNDKPNVYVVTEGKTVTYTMTPDIGYQIKKLTVSGKEVKLTNGALQNVDLSQMKRGDTVTVETNDYSYWQNPDTLETADPSKGQGTLTYNADGTYTFTFNHAKAEEEIFVEWEPVTADILAYKIWDDNNDKDGIRYNADTNHTLPKFKLQYSLNGRTWNDVTTTVNIGNQTYTLKKPVTQQTVPAGKDTNNKYVDGTYVINNDPNKGNTSTSVKKHPFTWEHLPVYTYDSNGTAGKSIQYRIVELGDPWHSEYKEAEYYDLEVFDLTSDKVKSIDGWGIYTDGTTSYVQKADGEYYIVNMTNGKVADTPAAAQPDPDNLDPYVDSDSWTVDKAIPYQEVQAKNTHFTTEYFVEVTKKWDDEALLNLQTTSGTNQYARKNIFIVLHGETENGDVDLNGSEAGEDLKKEITIDESQLKKNVTGDKTIDNHTIYESGNNQYALVEGDPAHADGYYTVSGNTIDYASGPLDPAPTNLKVVKKGDGTYRINNNEFGAMFEDLPTHYNGKEIEYTVKETDTSGAALTNWIMTGGKLSPVTDNDKNVLGYETTMRNTPDVDEVYNKLPLTIVKQDVNSKGKLKGAEFTIYTDAVIGDKASQSETKKIGEKIYTKTEKDENTGADVTTDYVIRKDSSDNDKYKYFEVTSGGTVSTTPANPQPVSLDLAENGILGGGEDAYTDGTKTYVKRSGSYHLVNNDGTVVETPASPQPDSNLIKEAKDEKTGAVTENVVTTGANGEAYISFLKKGTYYIKETKAPAGYNVDPTTYAFKVDEELKSITLESTNGEHTTPWWKKLFDLIFGDSGVSYDNWERNPNKKGGTLTVSDTPIVADVLVRKYWNDNDNQDGKRPGDKNNPSSTDDSSLDPEFKLPTVTLQYTTGAHTAEGLNVYTDGAATNPKKYVLKNNKYHEVTAEDIVGEYQTSAAATQPTGATATSETCSGLPVYKGSNDKKYVIINNAYHEADSVDKTGTVASSPASTQPKENVLSLVMDGNWTTVKIKNGNTEVDAKEKVNYVGGPVLTHQNDAYTWTDLPAYRDGKLVTYRILEEDGTGGKILTDHIYDIESNHTSQTHDMTFHLANTSGSSPTALNQTVDVTNKHDTQVINIEVYKEWDDEDPDDRRASTIRLYKVVNGIETVVSKGTGDQTQEDTGTVPVADQTKAVKVWKDLPTYEGGYPVTYRLKEDPVEGYNTHYTKVYKKSDNTDVNEESQDILAEDIKRTFYEQGDTIPSDKEVGSENTTAKFKILNERSVNVKVSKTWRNGANANVTYELWRTTKKESELTDSAFTSTPVSTSDANRYYVHKTIILTMAEYSALSPNEQADYKPRYVNTSNNNDILTPDEYDSLDPADKSNYELKYINDNHEIITADTYDQMSAAKKAEYEIEAVRTWSPYQGGGKDGDPSNTVDGWELVTSHLFDSNSFDNSVTGSEVSHPFNNLDIKDANGKVYLYRVLEKPGLNRFRENQISNTEIIDNNVNVSDGNVSLEVIKELEGRPWMDKDDFKFYLEAVNGKNITDPSNPVTVAKNKVPMPYRINPSSGKTTYNYTADATKDDLSVGSLGKAATFQDIQYKQSSNLYQSIDVGETYEFYYKVYEIYDTKTEQDTANNSETITKKTELDEATNHTGKKDGITYDGKVEEGGLLTDDEFKPTVHEAKVIVKNVNGTISTETQWKKNGNYVTGTPPVYTNTYSSEGTAKIWIEKELKNRAWNDYNNANKTGDAFEFKIDSISGSQLNVPGSTTSDSYTTKPLMSNSVNNPQSDIQKMSNTEYAFGVTGNKYDNTMLNSTGSGYFIYEISEDGKVNNYSDANFNISDYKVNDLTYDPNKKYVRVKAQDEWDGTISFEVEYFTDASCKAGYKINGYNAWIYDDGTATNAGKRLLSMTEAAQAEQMTEQQRKDAHYRQIDVAHFTNYQTVNIPVKKEWTDGPAVEDVNLHLERHLFPITGTGAVNEASINDTYVKTQESEWKGGADNPFWQTAGYTLIAKRGEFVKNDGTPKNNDGANKSSQTYGDKKAEDGSDLEKEDFIEGFNKNLPKYIVGDGKNGTTNGVVYRIVYRLYEDDTSDTYRRSYRSINGTTETDDDYIFTDGDTLVVTNKVVAANSASPAAVKQLLGRNWLSGDDFKFTLTPKGKAEYNADGSINDIIKTTNIPMPKEGKYVNKNDSDVVISAKEYDALTELGKNDYDSVTAYQNNNDPSDIISQDAFDALDPPSLQNDYTSISAYANKDDGDDIITEEAYDNLSALGKDSYKPIKVPNADAHAKDTETTVDPNGNLERLAKFNSIDFEISDLEYHETSKHYRGDFFYEMKEEIPSTAVAYDKTTGKKVLDNNDEEITFTEADRDKYVWKNSDGLAYDSDVHTVHIRVRENRTDELQVQIAYDEDENKIGDITTGTQFTPVYTNKYDATLEYSQTISKYIMGRAWKNTDVFDFRMTPLAGAPFEDADKSEFPQQDTHSDEDREADLEDGYAIHSARGAHVKRLDVSDTTKEIQTITMPKIEFGLSDLGKTVTEAQASGTNPLKYSNKSIVPAGTAYDQFVYAFEETNDYLSQVDKDVEDLNIDPDTEYARVTVIDKGDGTLDYYTEIFEDRYCKNPRYVPGTEIVDPATGEITGGEPAKTPTFVNQLKRNLSITKAWADPASSDVTMRLQWSTNGTNWYDVDKATFLTGQDATKTIAKNATGNNLTVKWSDLPAYANIKDAEDQTADNIAMNDIWIYYTIKEDPVNHVVTRYSKDAYASGDKQTNSKFKNLEHGTNPFKTEAAPTGSTYADKVYAKTIDKLHVTNWRGEQEGQARVGIVKQYVGSTWEHGESFDFEMTPLKSKLGGATGYTDYDDQVAAHESDSSVKVMPKLANNKATANEETDRVSVNERSANFAPLTIKLSDLAVDLSDSIAKGEFIYEIKEVIPDGATRITEGTGADAKTYYIADDGKGHKIKYTGETHTAKIVAEEDGSGNLEITVSYDAREPGEFVPVYTNYAMMPTPIEGTKTWVGGKTSEHKNGKVELNADKDKIIVGDGTKDSLGLKLQRKLKDDENFTTITSDDAGNPLEAVWVKETRREVTTENYIVTEDTEVDSSKTYYTESSGVYTEVSPAGTEDPSQEGWYEKNSTTELKFSYEKQEEGNGTYTVKAKVTKGGTITYEDPFLSSVDKDGHEYIYKIKEDTVPTNYTGTVVGRDITNTYNVKDSIKVTKTWDDSQDAAGLRPDGVVMHLYKETSGSPVQVEVDKKKITPQTGEKDTWTTGITWENLKVYDENGDIIKYIVVEESVSGYTPTYKVGSGTYKEEGDEDLAFELDGDTSTTQTVDVKNTLTPATDEVQVTKDWDDENNKYGDRPASVKFKLYKYAWDKTEKAYGSKQLVSGSGNASTGRPATKADVDAEKIKDPETTMKVGDIIKIEDLELNGKTDTDTDTQANETAPWVGKWINLPLEENGKTIIYVVEEDISDTDVFAAAGTKGKYSNAPYVSGDQVAGYTVKNTYTPETVSASVTKSWADNGNALKGRPDTLTVELWRTYKNASNENVWQKVSSDINGKNIKTVISADDVDSNNNTWKYTVTDLPKYLTVDVEESGVTTKQKREIIYYWRETVPDGYTATASARENPEQTADSGIQNVANNGTLTNNYITGTLRVTKTWDDAKNGDDVRPSAQDYLNKVTLFAGNTKITDFGDAPKVKREITPSSGTGGTGTNSNIYTITYSNLPVYDKDGDAISYSIEEGEIDGYSVSVLPDATVLSNVAAQGAPADYEGSITLTNKHEYEKTAIEVTKNWYDRTGYRHEDSEAFSDRLELYADGVKVTDAALLDNLEMTPATGGNTEDSFTAKWTDLPKYKKSGNKLVEIVYTVKEVGTVDGYAAAVYNNKASLGTTKAQKNEADKAYNGGEINNIQLITVDVEKTWDDNSDHDGQRPEEIKISFFQNGVPLLTTYGGPEKTLKKDEAQNATAGGKFTNQDNKYTWTKVLINLPYADANGVPYNYTAVETEAKKGDHWYNAFVGGQTMRQVLLNDWNTNNDTLTYRLTNQDDEDKVSFSVDKIWNDGSNVDNLRPATIKYKLYQQPSGGSKTQVTELPSGASISGGTIGTNGVITVTANDDDVTQGTLGRILINKLPKYASSGKEITYSIVEEAVFGYNLSGGTAQAVDGVGDQTSGITVTNVHAPVRTSVTPKAIKAIEGRTFKLGGETFRFLIEPLNGAPRPANDYATVTAGITDGKSKEFDLPEFTFTGADMTDKLEAGETKEFTYKLMEVNRGKTIDDLEYDDSELTLKITVTRKADGGLEVKADDPETTGVNESGVVWGTNNKDADRTFTNEYGATKKLTLRKVWVDDDADGTVIGSRPNKVTFTLTATATTNDEVEALTAAGFTQDATDLTKYTKDYELKTADATSEEDIWQIETADLPKYDAEGGEIVYSVSEERLPNYKAPSVIQKNNVFTVTNEYERRAFTGTKVWVGDSDEHDNAKELNSKLTLKRTYDGAAQPETVGKFNENKFHVDWDGNSFTIIGLPQKDQTTGKDYTYWVEEDSLPGYTTEYSVKTHTDENDEVVGIESGGTITNTRELTTATVAKVWDDAKNEAKKRPTEVSFQLYKRVASPLTTEEREAAAATVDRNNYGTDEEYDQAVQEAIDAAQETKNANVKPVAVSGKTIKLDGTADSEAVNGAKELAPTNGGNTWNGQITGLAASEGTNEVSYTFLEVDVPSNYNASYEHDYANNTSKVTNTYRSAGTIEVRKNWFDSENIDNTRTTITINLKRKLLNPETDEYGSLEAAKYITGDTAEAKTISGDMNKPEHVVWTKLPTHDENGNLIRYYIEETGANSAYEQVITYPDSEGSDKFIVLEHDDSSEVNSHWSKTARIANILKGTTRVDGTKTWIDHEDYSGTHNNASEVKLTLKRTYEGGTEETLYVEGGQGSYVDDAGNELAVVWTDEDNDDEAETYTFKAKNPDYVEGGSEPKYIDAVLNKYKPYVNEASLSDATTGRKYTYTVSEAAIDGYSTTYDNSRSTAASAAQKYETDKAYIGGEIVNSADQILDGLKVTKSWNDSKNSEGMRPESVTVHLYKTEGTGQSAKQVSAGEVEKTLNQANSWTETWTNLPVYDANGKKIEYIVVEEAVAGYETTFTPAGGKIKLDGETSEPDEVKISNKLVPGVSKVTASKYWDDESDAAGLRPETVTFELYEYVWNKTDKKYDGPTKVTKRPATEADVNADIADEVGDDVAVADLVLNGTADTENTIAYEKAKTDDNNWNCEWINLPKTKNGKTVIYTVKEKPETVTGYQTSVVTGNQVDGFKVTNTYEPLVGEVLVDKVWDDAGNEAGRRTGTAPIVKLQSTAKDPQAQGFDPDTDWQDVSASVAAPKAVPMDHSGKITDSSADKTYTWGNLPAFKDGKKLTYRVVETGKLAGYDNPTYSVATFNLCNAAGTESRNQEVTVTNTYSKTDVEVTKKWVDSYGNSSAPATGVRPSADEYEASVTLKADNQPVLDNNDEPLAPTVTDNGDGTFTLNWADLPKYKDTITGRSEIEYSVTETQVTGYSAPVYSDNGKALNGGTITNTQLVKVNVVKTWNDNSNHDGHRPTAGIKVTLYQNGRPYGTAQTLTKTGDAFNANTWTFNNVWTDLPYADANGTVYNYTAAESDITKWYQAFAGGTFRQILSSEWNAARDTMTFSIDNRDEEEVVGFTVDKIWNDGSDADSLRSDKIYYRLYKTVDGTKTLVGTLPSGASVTGGDFKTADGGYIEVAAKKNDTTQGTLSRVTVSGLPKFEAGAKEIAYSIEEDADVKTPATTETAPDPELLFGYTTAKTGSMTSGFTVTNMHNPASVTVAPVAKKVIEGRSFGSGDEFTFTITPKDSAPRPSADYVTIKPAAGTTANINLPDFTFTGKDMLDKLKAGDTKTFEYELAEVKGGLTDLSYDTSKKTLKITVTRKADGSLEIKDADVKWGEANAEADKTFKNIYGGKINMTIRKVWVDDDADSTVIDVRPDSVKVKVTATTTAETAALVNTYGFTKVSNTEYTKELTLTKDDHVWLRNSIWQIKTGDLPKLDSSDKVIEYAVTEDQVPNYKVPQVKKDDDRDDRWIVTNTYESGDFTATKVWDDGNLKHDNATELKDKLTLYRTTDTDLDSATWTRVTDEYHLHWNDDGQSIDDKYSQSFTITGLPEKASDGKTYTYRVLESSVGSGYTTTYANTGTYAGKDNAVYTGGTITNTNQGKVTAMAKKIWAGDKDDKSRREAVEFQLVRTVDGATKNIGSPKEATATSDTFEPITDAANDDYVVWSNLPTVVEGKAATYDVKEVEVPNGYTAKTEYGYDDEGTDKWADGKDSIPAGKTWNNKIRITNTLDNDTISVPVMVKWDDGKNRDGIRPDSTEVELQYKDENGDWKTYKIEGNDAKLTLDNANNWKASFDKVPKRDANGNEIEYRVVETRTSVITGTDASGEYAITEEGDSYGDTTKPSDGFTITNTHTPGKRTITATKVWNDPSSLTAAQKKELHSDVVLHLFGYSDEEVVYYAGSKKIEMDSDGVPEGQATWVDVPKRYYNNKDLEWKVVEDAVYGYTSKVTGDIANGFVVTNTYAEPTTSVSVTKEWQDDENNDGKRPTTVTYELWSKVGTQDATKIDEKEVNVAATAAGAASYEWTNLPATKKIETTETESTSRIEYQDKVTGYRNKTDKSDVISVAAYDALPSGDKANYEAITKSVPKEVKEDGVKVKKTVPILYVVKEKQAAGYEEPMVEAEGPGKFNVINARKNETVDIRARVIWSDNNDSDGIRPDHVVVKLKDDQGNETVAKAKITYKDTEDGWNEGVYVFKDLPKYKDGTEIKYTVVELDKDEKTERGHGSAAFDDSYAVTITGDGSTANPFVITNTHNPGGTITLEATKKWDGDDGHTDARQDVTFRLIKIIGGDRTKVSGKEKTIPSDATGEDLKVKWEDLPVTENGKAVTYDVEEDAIEGYKTTISDVEVDENDSTLYKVTVTNTYSVVPEKEPGDVLYIDPRAASGKMILSSTRYDSYAAARSAAEALKGKPSDPKHEGYTFLGWDLNRDENGNNVLVARYSAASNALPLVTYIDGQSSNAVRKSVHAKNANSVKAPKDPSHRNLKFAGWKKVTDSAGNTLFIAEYEADCKNAVKKNPTVTYIDPATGRVIQKARNLNKDGTEPPSPKNPTRKGYVFTGWKRTVDGDGDIVYEATWSKYKPGGKWENVRTGDTTNAILWGCIVAAAIIALIALIAIRRRRNSRG